MIINIVEIIDFLKVKHPEEKEIINGLENCGLKETSRRPYIYFISPESANEKGAEWQFKENFICEHPKYGTLIFDILEDNKVGGIEFLKYL